MDARKVAPPGLAATARAPVRSSQGGERWRWTEQAPGRAGLRLIGHRLLTAIPVLFGTTLLAFFLLDILPGSAARQLLGAEATVEEVAKLEARLSLDRPAAERYVQWLGRAMKGDLGRSIASGQPVDELILERLPVSAELVGLAFVLSLGLSVPAALLAAHKPNRTLDRATMLISMAGLSTPSYVLALLLVLVFSVTLGQFSSIGFSPISQGILPNLHSLTLPSLALALPLCCFYTRFLRGDLAEQIAHEDYIITAVAKGISSWQVLVRHALRNSLAGLLTLVGLHFGSLISGTVLVEQIFALPGTGQLLLQAITIRDAPVVQAIVLFTAVTTVLANLCVDLLYALLDPRIRYAQE
jgi:peptide/nickel transport system permease protein